MQTIKRVSRYIGLYGAIAFITGFVLMAYELVASRILAPSIGTSTYVWTSVIGVMIAALAAGYAAGGWLADKRVAKADIAWLLIATSLAIVWTCLNYEGVLQWVASFVRDTRVQGVVAAILLFMPASFLLGVISPYLARLRTRSLTTTGRSVAGLSALNSLGGITGTFCAGFIFFSFIGSRETLAMMAAVLLATSWLITPGRHTRLRVLISVAVAITLAVYFFVPLKPGVVARIDTPSSHYEVLDMQYRGQPMRGLVMGPLGVQSGVLKNHPDQLVFSYIRKLADLVAVAPHKDRILILGGGAFTLPEYLGRNYPASTIDVVEIDPQLEAISKQYFDYQALPNVHSYAEDARTFLNNTHNKYDIVIVDVYNDISVPFALTTREYAAAVKQATKANGVVLANIIASTNDNCMPFFASVDTSYKTVFDQSVFFPVGSAPLTVRQNIVAVYGQDPAAWAKGGQTHILTGGMLLTDNFAPVERLRQQCETN